MHMSWVEWKQDLNVTGKKIISKMEVEKNERIKLGFKLINLNIQVKRSYCNCKCIIEFWKEAWFGNINVEITIRNIWFKS